MKSNNIRDLNNLGRKQAGKAFAEVKKIQEKQIQQKAMKKKENPFRHVERYPEKRLADGSTIVQISASHNLPARIVRKNWSDKRPLQLDLYKLAEKVNSKHHRS